jgi:hypothetical protein
LDLDWSWLTDSKFQSVVLHYCIVVCSAKLVSASSLDLEQRSFPSPTFQTS